MSATQTMRNQTSEEALRSLPNPGIVLRAGFTTVRDVGTYRALTKRRDSCSVRTACMIIAASHGSEPE